MTEFLKENRRRIEDGYRRLSEEFPELFAKITRVADAQEEDTALAFRYLYMTMPLSDIGNYAPEIYLDFARCAAALYHDEVRLRALPEEIFLNYVLYHRVNEEEIDECRMLFHDLLAERIRGLAEGEAALEVNYWCAEQVTYQSSDDRTLSARTVYLRGSGRCGEESVFAVNALRSVGIPARQVYAPKWSHSDDNHAWVEVFADGAWQYLGGCEPEAVLNRGWFTNAASRAMMIHSRWFDPKPPGAVTLAADEIMGRPDAALLINSLARYAHAKHITIKVTDALKRPIPGAAVSFEVLNYAALVPIASGVTDETGRVRLLTGRGSLYLCVRAGGQVAERVIDLEEEYRIVVRKTESGMPAREEDESQTVVVGGREEVPDTWIPFDMAAPEDAPIHTTRPSAAQIERGKRRAREAGVLREKKRSAFVNTGIRDFLSAEPGKNGWKHRLVAVLSDKDRSDAKAEVLLDHYTHAMPYKDDYPEDIFTQYLLNPRVADEVLSPYRSFFLDVLEKEQKEAWWRTPEAIRDYIEAHIQTHGDRERASVYTKPEAAWKLESAGGMSKKVLFVAIARTLGIPAQICQNDEVVQYYRDGGFHPVRMREEKQDTDGPKPGTGRLGIFAADEVRWKYGQNYSIARKTDEGYHLLHPEEIELSGGKISDAGRELWLSIGNDRAPGTSGSLADMDQGPGMPDSSTGTGQAPDIRDSSAGTRCIRTIPDLPAGTYRLLTTLRLPGGNQFAYRYYFRLRAGQTKELVLRQRDADLSDMLLNIALSDFTLADANGKTVSAHARASGHPHLFIWLEEGMEPTEHILEEMLALQEAYEKESGSITLIARDTEALSDRTLRRVTEAIGGLRVCFDPAGENMEALGRRMYIDFEKMPMIVCVDHEFNGVFGMSGYNVGTGTLLLRLLDRLESR